MKGGLFITGTDTDVGKTWVTVRLIEALRERGVDAVGMKPIESGGTKDSEALLAASSRATRHASCLAEPSAGKNLNRQRFL